MPEHRVTIEYHAHDDGSRKRPFIVLDEGRYGRIHRVARIFEEIYSITFFSEDDPDEILQTLRSASEGGVFVLRMIADDSDIFTHAHYQQLMDRAAKKKSTPA